MPHPFERPAHSSEPEPSTHDEFVVYRQESELRIPIKPMAEIRDPLAEGLEFFSAHASWFQQHLVGPKALERLRSEYGPLMEELFAFSEEDADRYRVQIIAASTAVQHYHELLVVITDTVTGNLVVSRAAAPQGDDPDEILLTPQPVPKNAFRGEIVTVAKLNEEPEVLAISPLMGRTLFDIEAQRVAGNQTDGVLGADIRRVATALCGHAVTDFDVLSSTFSLPKPIAPPDTKKLSLEKALQAQELWEDAISEPRRVEFLIRTAQAEKVVLFAGQQSHRVGLGVNIGLAFGGESQSVESAELALNSESLHAAFRKKYTTEFKRVVELNAAEEQDLKDRISKRLRTDYKSSWRQSWNVSIEAVSISPRHGSCAVLVGIQDTDLNYIIPDRHSQAFARDNVFAGIVLIVNMARVDSDRFSLPPRGTERIGYNSTVVPLNFISSQVKLLTEKPTESIFYQQLLGAISADLRQEKGGGKVTELISIDASTRTLDLHGGGADLVWLLCQHEYGHTLVAIRRSVGDGVVPYDLAPQVISFFPK